MLAELGIPHQRLRFIHVAGTNGKGSTCAMLESALRAAGRRTGLFTSPHLAEPTERIRIDGVPVSAERFAAAFDDVHAAVEHLLGPRTPSTCTPPISKPSPPWRSWSSPRRRVDVVVLEVGLGGRLDATNVVTPELCVITPIDFDHEIYLGRGLEAIAGEKAGILKAGVPAVFARQRPEAAAVLDLRAAQLCIAVARTAAWKIADLELDARGSRFLPRRRTRNCASSARWPASTRWKTPPPPRVALTRRGVPERAIAAGIAATAGPAAWSASPRARRSSSTAPTIPPERAPWPLTSRASTPAAACA